MKRSLTSNEINHILNDCTIYCNIPSSIKKTTIEKITSPIRNELTQIKIYPECIPELKKEIIRKFNMAMAPPGEAVGVITAQSIGERQTQMTLNSFHSAGLAIQTVVTGVPRFSELLAATKNPKSIVCNVYPDKKQYSIQQLRDYLGIHLTSITIQNIVKSYTILKESPQDIWYNPFITIHQFNKKYLNWMCIRLQLNIEVLYEHKISLRHISREITDTYNDLKCVYSPNYIGLIDVYINTDEIKLQQDVAYIHKNNYIDVYIKEIVIPNLYKIQINGVENVSNIFYTKQNDGSWYIQTSGGHISNILSLPFVDKVKSMCNNMWDIYQTFGIEATRQFIIDEFIHVVSSDGTYINQRHVTVLVDIMTNTGCITSISRYGTTRGSFGIISKASFEESIDNFMKAGFFSEKEYIDGVSPSILCGVRSGVGTGMIDVKPMLSL